MKLSQYINFDNYMGIYNSKLEIYEWYDLNKKIHRNNDKPAAILYNGTKFWYRHGLTHRDSDKPAVMGNDGYRWYKNGKLHRDYDLPAIIEVDVSTFPIYVSMDWYKNGYWHRIYNMPAVISDYILEWWKFGRKIKHKYK
jgi:hypothetical protein